MNILIVGKSDLGKELAKLCVEHNVTIVGRPEYDITSQYECNRIVREYNPDCVVLTQGTLNNDTWNSLTVNCTSTIYLISEFYEKMTCGQIISVSSATVNWQSWPGIETHKLVYATAKTALSDFCKHMNRKNIPDKEEKDVSIQVYEPNNFVSQMGIDSEQDIQPVAQELFSLVNNRRISVLQGLNRSVQL
jgi:short-subunit dehydrogenase